eukprot:6214334-Pleurochrysis_carterae.AAC.1
MLQLTSMYAPRSKAVAVDSDGNPALKAFVRAPDSLLVWRATPTSKAWAESANMASIVARRAAGFMRHMAISADGAASPETASCAEHTSRNVCAACKAELSH